MATKKKPVRVIDPKFFKLGAVWEVKDSRFLNNGYYQIKGKQSQGNRYLERIYPTPELNVEGKLKWHDYCHTTCDRLIEGVDLYIPLSTEVTSGMTIIYGIPKSTSKDIYPQKGFEYIPPVVKPPKPLEKNLLTKIKDFICGSK